MWLIIFYCLLLQKLLKNFAKVKRTCKNVKSEFINSFIFVQNFVKKTKETQHCY